MGKMRASTLLCARSGKRDMRAKWEKGYARQERFYFWICAHVHF